MTLALGARLADSALTLAAIDLKAQTRLVLASGTSENFSYMQRYSPMVGEYTAVLGTINYHGSRIADVNVYVSLFYASDIFSLLLG